MELDILPTALYFRIAETFPRMTISDISRVILEQRKIKDSQEVEATREACRMVHQGHTRILEVLRDGMTELELSAEVEDAHRKAGHEGLYFVRQFDFFMGRGPVASGENLSRIAGKVQSITGVGLSRSIPLGASRKEIRTGEMVVVDVPTICNGYHSDQSRTYVLGKAPWGCKALYEGLKELADRVLQELKPGMRSDRVYEQAIGIAEELHIEPAFMRIGRDRKKIPFIGHGVGLELNEPPMISPSSSDTIEEGMIFALEMEMTNGPSEVVKLEDTILVTADGPELLTITPRGLHEV
ncbi:MAG: Xaa-Pro peptidase family protein [Deltaproteobacteria bacterium]